MISIADITIALRIDVVAFSTLAAILTLSTVFVCRRVWQRLHVSNTKRLSICSLNLIAAILLLLVFTQITFSSSVNNHLNLVTNAEVTIDSSQADGRYVYLTDTQSDISDDSRAQITLAELAKLLPSFSSVTLHGNGLSELQWQQLETLVNPQQLPDFRYSKEETHQLNNRIGFKYADWQREVVVGEPLIINLELTDQQSDSGLYQVQLHDPSNTLVANETARRGDTVTFETVPKSIGRWLYSASIQSSDGTEVVEEKVFVNVKPGISPNVLIFQSAPSFETRHLQNWLSDMNAQVRIETQISQTKFRQQSINIDTALLSQWQQPFAPELLQWADLLVIDMRRLYGLEPKQVAAIEKAVIGGLGLYILADNSIHEAQPPPFLKAITDQVILLSDTEKTVLPHWLGFTARQPVKSLPSRFAPDSGGLIITDENNRGLVKAIDLGAGKLATALFNSAYTWRIGGNRQLHSRYWQWVLTEVARRTQSPKWDLQSFTLLDNATSHVKLCASGLSSSSMVTVQSERHLQALELTLNKSVMLEQDYCTSFWQQKAGWHTLVINSEEVNATDHVYLYSRNDWQVLNQFHRKSATQKRISNPSSTNEKQQYNRIPEWIIALLWMLTMTLLWVEQRWFMNK